MEDLERNNGKDKPYFMSKNLMKLLHARNQKYEGTDAPDGDNIELDQTIQLWGTSLIHNN